MRLLSRAIFWGGILLISGCASVPPIPQLETKYGDRIGVFVEIGPRPTHTHIGTTIFNNFAKEYPYDWQLEAALTEGISKTLKNAGYTAVNLKDTGLQYPQVAKLIVASEGKWQIAPGKEKRLQQLRDDMGLRALFVLKESPVTAAMECGAYGCTFFKAQTSGVYTRSFFGFTNYYSVAAIDWGVFVLNPLVDLAQGEKLGEMLRIPSVPFFGHSDPGNFDNITEADFSSIREDIVRFSVGVTYETIRSLNQK